MFQDITLTDLLTLQKSETPTLIDVRSPKEYQDATIPGSMNIPVFTNEERAEVGTLYKEAGPEAAKERGLAIFSAKLPAFIEEFKKIDTPKIVFCWRGGMRSKTAATVLDLMGIPVTRLLGGIRSYRRWVVSMLEKQDFNPKMYILNGYTGSGKTFILKQLQKKGYPVMDLEGMANHRGSIFGHIGLVPNNQRKFDSMLVQEMICYQDVPYILLEGESKRIGKVVLPDFFHDKKEQGVQIFINLPVEERIQNVLEDYQPWDYPEKFMAAFQYIKKRIHTPVAKQIDDDLHNQQYASAVKLLLEYYYDPRYEHTTVQYPAARKVYIKANSVKEAQVSVEEYIKQLQKSVYL